MAETEHGEFWMDGDETHKVQGVLTYGSDIPGTLRLSGHLESLISRLGNRDTGMRDILGVLAGGMQCVTLRDCFATNTTGFPEMPGATQEYICNRVFKGHLIFPNGEQINAQYLTVSMQPLTEWACGKDLIESDWRQPRNEPRTATFLPDERISVEGCRSETLDFSVEIWRSVGLSEGWNRRGRWLKAEPRSWFKLIPASADAPIESLTAIVHQLQLMLAMLVDTTALINKVSFRIPDDIELERERDGMRDMAFFQDWLGSQHSDDEDVKKVRLETSIFMRQVKPDIIREWFKLYDYYYPAVNWLLSSYFNPGLPVDIRFDTAFTSVERLLSQHLGAERSGRKAGYRKGESRASAASLVQFIESTGLSDISYFKSMDPDARQVWADRVMKIRDKDTAHLDWGGSQRSPEGKECFQQATVLTCLGAGFLMTQMNIPWDVITGTLDNRLSRHLVKAPSDEAGEGGQS